MRLRFMRFMIMLLLIGSIGCMPVAGEIITVSPTPYSIKQTDGSTIYYNPPPPPDLLQTTSKATWATESWRRYASELYDKERQKELRDENLRGIYKSDTARQNYYLNVQKAYDEGIKKADTTTDPKLLSFLWEQKADLYKATADHEKAVDSYTKAIATLDQYDTRKIELYRSMAYDLRALGKDAEANRAHDEADKIQKQTGYTSQNDYDLPISPALSILGLLAAAGLCVYRRKL